MQYNYTDCRRTLHTIISPLSTSNMLNFRATNTGINIEYSTDHNINNEWIWNELTSNNEVRLSKIFSFELADLIEQPTTNEDLDSYTYQFKLGAFEGEYIKIPGRILGISNDLAISRNIKIKRSTFAAERNIPIFPKLAKLLNHSNPIIIGGSHPGAIPQIIFEELLRKFPNAYELDRYADARIQTILAQYLDGMKDARAHYERYLTRRLPAWELPRQIFLASNI